MGSGSSVSWPPLRQDRAGWPYDRASWAAEVRVRSRKPEAENRMRCAGIVHLPGWRVVVQLADSIFKMKRILTLIVAIAITGCGSVNLDGLG